MEITYIITVQSWYTNVLQDSWSDFDSNSVGNSSRDNSNVSKHSAESLASVLYCILTSQ